MKVSDGVVYSASLTKLKSESPFTVLIRTRLRATRTRKNLTQATIAQRAGLAQATIAKLELGAVTLDLDYLDAYATALGLTPAEIIAGPSIEAQLRKEKAALVTTLKLLATDNEASRAIVESVLALIGEKP